MTVAALARQIRKYVDTKTRYPGIYARHQLCCAKALDKTKRCSCTPSYYGKVWDPAIRRHRPTERRPTISEAKNLRDDLAALVRTGKIAEGQPDEVLVESPTEAVAEGPIFAEAHDEFIADCNAGVVRNKFGKRYTRKSIKSLDSGLKRVPSEVRKQPITQATPGQFQRMVDALVREGLSGERIATIVNAVRSFYRWAIAREKATENPAAEVQIPVDDDDPERIPRIATPGEFVVLLDSIPAEDGLAWALAGYATARHQEIEALGWKHVSFSENVVLLGGDKDAKKSEAARRIVPMVDQLRTRLEAECIRQGRPTSGPVFPAKREDNTSDTADLHATLRRIKKRWKKLGKEPITFQDSRHTAATWLDHAGVSPKVASVIMGHKAPKLKQFPDAAPITLKRYTHVLKGELERACRQLQTFLDEREAEERKPQA